MGMIPGKVINHKYLKWEGGVLKGDAQEHFKKDKIPKHITVRGKYYNVKFKRVKGRRDRDNKVIHHEYHAVDDDPRLARLQLHIQEAFETEPALLEEDEI